MPSTPVEYKAQAQDHRPSRVEWVGFALSLLLLLVIAYGIEAYLSYRSETAAARLPAASQLAALQQPLDLDRVGAHQVDIRSRLLGGKDSIYKEQTDPSAQPSRTPFVVLCPTRCPDRRRQVEFWLAYGVHYDRDAGTDNWDFWFAPVQRGRWVADPVRLLYRVNPSQADAWGLVDGDWTDADVGFSENKVARIEELGETSLAGYLRQIVSDQNLDAANRIEAPVESLTIHSDFADRALLMSPPGWHAIGTAVDDVRSGLPGFLSEASSGRTLAQWLGDNWGNLIQLLLLLIAVLGCAIKGWWAIGVYCYYRLRDEIEAQKLAAIHQQPIGGSS